CSTSHRRIGGKNRPDYTIVRECWILRGNGRKHDRLRRSFAHRDLQRDSPQFARQWESVCNVWDSGASQCPDGDSEDRTLRKTPRAGIAERVAIAGLRVRKTNGDDDQCHSIWKSHSLILTTNASPPV